jgi:tartrate dehydrogenase/decarboxylase/D-malate dehydrogenase
MSVRKRVGVIAGDGVGPEVIAEAVKVMTAVSDCDLVELPWGSGYWRETGSMMPADGVDIVRDLDAVLLGAVGSPDVPDHITLWGLLLALRQQLDLWANVRPARLLEGTPSPLRVQRAGDIDMLFVRENTEGEYSGVGGRAHAGLAIEVALETSVFTRAGVERVIRYAFEQANARSARLISATKSNASRFGYVLWDEVFDAVAEEFRAVETERVLVDALAARMVRDPSSIDVVVASNLFGDILTDLAGALQGGLGMCASANLAPGAAPSLSTPIFEPVHGSAPDIAGQGLANPVGAVWSTSLLLESLGELEAAAAVMQGIEETILAGICTRDIGGSSSTSDVGTAIATRAEALRHTEPLEPGSRRQEAVQ